MQSLSFEQAPPLSAPLRFFHSAPLFGLLAALLLVLRGEEVFLSRWTPAALATVHLLTTGLMLQVMVGALFQFIPVAVGGNLAHPLAAARRLHPLLALAALTLAGAFLRGEALLYPLAVALFAVALGAFAVLVLHALWRTSARNATVAGLALAVAGLLLGGLFGMGAALGRSGHGPLAWLQLSSLHVGWVLGLWGLGLVAAVSWMVVPMFQLTPPYPPRATRAFPVLLALAALAGLLPGLLGEDLLAAGLGLLAGAFALATLQLQRRRRRKEGDATFRFWRSAMLSVLAALAALLGARLGGPPALVLLAGVLLLVGGFVAVITGMLYKIVPFISWLHLKSRLAKPPHMTRLIPEEHQARHYGLHLTALLVLLAAPWSADAARVGGALLGLSCLFLSANLWLAGRRTRAALAAQA